MKKKNIKIGYVLLVMSLYLLNVAGVQAQEKKDSLVNVAGTQAQENKEDLVNVAFGKVAREDLLGGVSSVKASELMKKSFTTNSLDNLQSFIGGYNGNIWGQAGLVLVDGVPRSASDIRYTEIESITVLKAASAVALYGSKAAKGVILITTKRGENKPLSIDIRANSGLYFPKAYPSYLNAADYMTLYNEACVNDGIAPKYSQDLIDNTDAGSNPYRYPDVDFFSSDYLRKSYNRSDVTSEISGGNDRTHYYSNVGLSYNNSLLKYGEMKNYRDVRLNIRTNVDVNLTSWLKASTNAVAIFADNYSAFGDFWGTSATLRPNWFSPFVPISMLDPNNSSLQTMVTNSNHVIDGKYLLGGTSTDLTNAFSDMAAAGYNRNKNRTFMFDVNLGADLGTILKGLSFKTGFSMDYKDLYTELWQAPSYAVYQPTWSWTADGTDVITGLTKYNNDAFATLESVGTTTYSQTMSLTSQFNYNRTFNEVHNLSATLVGWGYQTQYSSDADHSSSTYHRLSNINLGLQVGYNYRHTYYLDFSGSEIHSAKLASGHRNVISPTVSAGWRISNEDFFKDKVSFVNDLKLTASYANLHQDIDLTNYYMYQGYYDNRAGWFQWRDGNAGGNMPLAKQGPNTDLTLVQREEIRFGLEASLLNRLITLETNYFSQNTNGLLATGANSIYPSYFVNGTDFSLLPNLNYNKDKRTGVDFALNLNKKLGQFDCSLGFVGMYYSSKAVQRDEVYADHYQYRTGKPIDSYWGYVSDGFFNDLTDIANSPLQKFGEVKPGDLKYKDINQDGVVDTRDQVNLGHNGWDVSPFTYGINLTMKWKNFTLFAMGTGSRGAIGFKNSSYYWVKGSSKYSRVVWGRWTEDTKDVATYPRLTTKDNTNDFQNSTFWMYKTNRFDLSKVQLTYDLGENFLKKSFVHALSMYVSGESLITMSGQRRLMETNVGSAPQCRFFNLGVKASF
jgi:TonB-linked SusC/RagA family outer membrane protein